MSDIDNGQHWLDRNRSPRVQITYDVEIGDAIEKKTLPLVVGILSDLGGLYAADGSQKMSFPERKFIDIDRDNFDNVLETISPGVKIALPASTIESNDDSANGFQAELVFTKIDDFNPLQIVMQVPELKALFDNRQRLRDMLARMDGNVPLGAALLKTFEAPPGVDSVA